MSSKDHAKDVNFFPMKVSLLEGLRFAECLWTVEGDSGPSLRLDRGIILFGNVVDDLFDVARVVFASVPVERRSGAKRPWLAEYFCPEQYILLDAMADSHAKPPKHYGDQPCSVSSSHSRGTAAHPPVDVPAMKSK